MIWVIAVIIVITILFFVMNGRSAPTVRQTNREDLSSAISILAEQKPSTATDVRSTALKSYDAIAAAARNAGKDEAFAHQVGVLQALTAVTSPGQQSSTHSQREFQMEAAPFNKVSPAEGRLAVVEYLVWKFFPDQADETAFAPALRRFRDEIHADEGVSDSVIYGLLYSMKYDWQRWLSEHREEPDSGER